VCALGYFLVFSASVLRQIARYLPHHRSENASKTHPKSSHDKFKTASEKKKRLIADYVRIAPALGISPEEQERQVNLMLDDLVKLLKQKK